MLPLAVILKGLGFTVSGSDRSYDQGRTPEKFAWISAQGINLYPQDGSGITPEVSSVVISKAVEDTIPDIAAAKSKNIPILKRVDVLIDLFNHAERRIAISGTSGKTTTTGMTGFLLKEAGLDPTIMNGGIFRNYAAQNPYSTAFVGKSDIFVTEIDESDGIEAVTQFEPDIAVIHNISLDHQPMEELKRMFAGFLSKTQTAVLNADDGIVMDMGRDFGGKIITYSAQGHQADLVARNIAPHPDGIESAIFHDGEAVTLKLQLPGRHNISNALAAIAVGLAIGLSLEKCAEILARFQGIKRRMEVVGSSGGITVMDDFAHNPDKIAATLGTMKQFPGRLHIFFQPHGYGFLKVVGKELGESFAQYMGEDDILYMVEPFYAGGTVDRSVGSQSIIDDIVAKQRMAYLMPGRQEVKAAILKSIKPGDRIIVMGARDDTLSSYATEILGNLAENRN